MPEDSRLVKGELDGYASIKGNINSVDVKRGSNILVDSIVEDRFFVEYLKGSK